MVRRSIFAMVLSVLTSTGFGLADEIKWYGDFQAAHQAAVNEQRLLLIHFWGPQCPPCKRLELTVFPDPNVVAMINRNYSAVKVNGDSSEGSGLLARFQVDQYPTDIIATPEGQILYRFQTPQDPMRYVHELSAVHLAHAKKRSLPANRAGNWPHGVQADTSLSQGDVTPTPPDQFRSQLGTDVADRFGATDLQKNVQTFPAAVASRYDSPQQVYEASASSPEPREIVNHYSSEPEAGPAGVDIPPAASRGVSNPFSRSVTSHDSFRTANNFSTPNPPGESFSSGQNGQTQDAVAPSLSRPSSPPIALDGRCPVTLTTSRTWRKGDPQWGAIHRGRTYLFAGPREQRAFLEDPDRFSPVLAGIDLVHLSEGRAIEGDRRFGILFHEPGQESDRIYLFSTEESRNRFEQEPERYLRPVMQAMQSDNLEGLLR